MIMAHMCTSLSIMRPKLYTDPKQNNHKLEFLLLYKQSFFSALVKFSFARKTVAIK